MLKRLSLHPTRWARNVSTVVLGELEKLVSIPHGGLGTLPELVAAAVHLKVSIPPSGLETPRISFLLCSVCSATIPHGGLGTCQMVAAKGWCRHVSIPHSGLRTGSDGHKLAVLKLSPSHTVGLEPASDTVRSRLKYDKDCVSPSHPVGLERRFKRN